MNLYAKDVTLDEIKRKVLEFPDKKLKDDLNKFLSLKHRDIISHLKGSLIELLEENEFI